MPIERYQWPLAASLAAIASGLLLGETRRVAKLTKVATAALVLLAARTEARHAGLEKFEAKDYAGALGEFDSELKRRDGAELHFDAGAAAYELGDYARAAAAFSKALGTAPPELKNRAAYNLANTIARRAVALEKKADKIGSLKDAVRQYDEVLKSEPKHEDAQHNREIVTKLIAELEKEEQKEKEDEKKDEKEKQDQEKKDQDKQDSSQDGKDGKDDPQKQNPDASQKDGSGKDPKDDKKEQEKKDGGKDDQQKDGQEKKDSQQQKSDGQQKDGKDEPGAEKKDAQQQNPDEKPGDKPQPQPKDGADDKQKSGEVKAANPGQQDPEKQDPAAEAAEAAQAAQEGRMTEKDAAQILEAMKRVDRRVRLLDPKDEPVKSPSKPFKNW